VPLLAARYAAYEYKYTFRKETMNTTRNKQSRSVMARVMRGGQRHQANFALTEYRTWKAAEAAAQKWLRKTLKKLPERVMPQKGMQTKRNTSGIVGVRLAAKRKHSEYDKKYEYWYWVAHWPGCPFSGGVSWPVNKFGDDGAFVLAVLTRKHESTDRDAMLAKYRRYQKTKACKQLLKKKELYLG
jgi:hypothetical protein